MQLFCRLIPPPMLTAHPKKMSLLASKTRRGCRYANLASTLGVTAQCDFPFVNSYLRPCTRHKRFVRYLQTPRRCSFLRNFTPPISQQHVRKYTVRAHTDP